jgi:hypothetical protein
MKKNPEFNTGLGNEGFVLSEMSKNYLFHLLN